MPNLRPTTYEIREVFDAPPDFVFRWCTDYRVDDGTRAGEGYARRILSRGLRRIVYEDLESEPKGWRWARFDVRLSPPDHWHAESVGNMRYFRLDYDLRARPDGRTEFRLRGTRTPTPHGGPNPSRSEMERYLHRLWRNLGRALEREYRSRSTARPSEPAARKKARSTRLK